MSEHEPTDPPINRFGTRLNGEYMAPSCEHQIEPCISNACCCTCHVASEIEEITTENVRNVYAYVGQGFSFSERRSAARAHAEFDSWLNDHDAWVSAHASRAVLVRVTEILRDAGITPLPNAYGTLGREFGVTA